jgi:hypothetical protein
MDMPVKTVLGSLNHYEKGGVELIDGDPRHYVFSNVFEVASKSRPYEKVAVGRNLKYVLEAIRAEGASSWYTASHDEAAIIMDGRVEIRLVKLDTPASDEPEGTTILEGNPKGRKMGRMVVRRGHMALLPRGGRLSVSCRRPGGDPPANHPRPSDDRALERDLSNRLIAATRRVVRKR